MACCDISLKKKVLAAKFKFLFCFFYVYVAPLKKCILCKTRDSGDCPRQVAWEEHQPQDRLLRQTGSPASRQLQDPFPLLECVQTVLLSLSHWTHVFHTGDESVPFARNICLLVSCQDDLRDMARGERLSPFCTHSGPSCDLMLLWVWPRLCVSWEGHSKDLCVWVFARMNLPEDVCTDIWLNRHANTPKILQDRLVSRVKMSNTAY